MWTKLSEFLRDFRILAAPYWSSEERWPARGLLSLVVGLSLAEVWLLVQFNTWYQQFYDGLQKYDETSYWPLIGRFAVLAAAILFVRIYQVYWQQMLQIRWRRWLTDRYVSEWMADRSYYRLPLYETNTDNPDQRIAEDLRLFV